MTNLPTNPTRTELLEHHWLEFLQYVKQHNKPNNASKNSSDKPSSQLCWEDVFWGWYVRHKIAPVEEPKPEPKQ